MDRLLDEKPLG